MLFPIDKRWNGRRQFWIQPPNRFTPSDFGYAIIPEKLAKPFVLRHHYSGSYPAARLAVGMFRNSERERDLCGVAVFSVGMQQHGIPAYTGFPAAQGVELGRFVLLDTVGFNGESAFLAQALRALRDSLPSIEAVLSYADPIERFDATTQQQIKPAHYGTIYQASNAYYARRSRPNIITIGPDQRTICGRTLSKIKLNEVGHAYARKQLIDSGAPPLAAGESGRAWIERLERIGALRKLRHPGCFAYVFGLTPSAKRAIEQHLGAKLPYPKNPTVSRERPAGS